MLSIILFFVSFTVCTWIIDKIHEEFYRLEREIASLKKTQNKTQTELKSLTQKEEA